MTFGCAHPTLGEEVAAAVVLHEPKGATEAALIKHCRESLAEYKCPEKIYLVESIPTTATGKIRRRAVAAALLDDQRMRFLIAGAGAIGAYIGARMAQAGFDVTLYARGPHLRAMQEHGVQVKSSEGDFVARPRIAGSLEEVGPVDVVFLGVKAHGLPQLAPQLKPVLGPRTTVVSTQNGIPWWYFQGFGGEWEGRRLERVDPGGVISAGHRSAAGRRVHHLFFDGDHRAGSDSTHRREPDFARRAGRHAFGPLPANCRGAHRFGLALPGHHAHPPRDLGKDSGQRIVQSGERADTRHTGADVARSGGVFA